ncbi:PIN domain-containing protein [Methyloligella solikamskensis]|uniref:PIN domain-containing protein n=1 Tax=Methyloligella solikamskensis TaxID=1177756 RepID=A0ABW3J7W4_9HYPH
MADRFVVVLDANVLYPFRVRDALLRFAEAGLYRARWSPSILKEWVDNLLAEKPHLAVSIESQFRAMEAAFPEALVTGFSDLIESLELPDPNDRHVLAAAIRCGAQQIVTENLKDFPEDCLKPWGLEAVSADTFLASTYELYPAEATSALRRMRADYQNPKMNVSEFLLDLTKSGLVKTVGIARSEVDLL